MQAKKDKELSDLKNSIAEAHKNLTQFQDSINTKQNQYHTESINIRNGLLGGQKQLEQRQQDLTDSLFELKQMMIKKELSDIRWELLNFANSVMDGRKFNKEQYDHVIEIYEDYEKIIRDNDITNGKVAASMEFVMNKYKELLESGFER